VTSTPVRLLLVALLIAINGFFAGAETALLSVRHSRLRQMAEEGFAGAQAALNLLSNPERLLSVTQVGVTLTSLALGWAGEDTVYGIITGWLQPIETPLTVKLLHGASFLLSFLVISYLRLVVGIGFASREAALAQFIYLVMFSYAFFLEGFTGLAITIGSVLTLFVVMQVTGRIRWAEKFTVKPTGEPASELQ